MNAMEIIEWIQAWYLDQCDGHWEHQYGMVIETLDNPGWSIRVELEGTDYAIPDETWKQIELSERDWYGYKIEKNVFEASGDPAKLGFLLRLFKEKVGNPKLSSDSIE